MICFGAELDIYFSRVEATKPVIANLELRSANLRVNRTVPFPALVTVKVKIASLGEDPLLDMFIETRECRDDCGLFFKFFQVIQ